MIWGEADVIIEIKWTVTVMCLNHPETILPTGVCGKTDFHKFGPWNQNQPFWSGRYAYWRKGEKGEKIPGFLTAVLMKCSCLSLLSHSSCVQLFAAPMDCSLPGSSINGILQASILEWVATPPSRGSFWPRDWTYVFCLAGEFLTAEL